MTSASDRTAQIIPYRLKFKRPAGTSRGVLHEKDTWFLVLHENGRRGIGEIAMFRGLSAEDTPEFPALLEKLKRYVFLPLENLLDEFGHVSSIVFGLEQALLSLHAQHPALLFPSAFTRGEHGIPINGLIWMGPPDFMRSQVTKKIQAGFRVIKIKIGALDWDTELELLSWIRKEFGPDIELRTDANGAFSPAQAMERLEQLAELNVHSIEQPIAAGKWEEMARLCESTPVPIALDEELIGKALDFDRRKFLELIRPQYIILKPSLHGGFTGTDAWIEAAEALNIGWWITSALESNIGLNAIAQYTFKHGVSIPQGLGTGRLFTNNIPSPLEVKGDALFYDPLRSWKYPFL